MAYPIVELIAQALKTQLETVTAANGYDTDVAGVYRPTRLGGIQWADLTIGLFQDDPTLVGNLEGGESDSGMVRWLQPFQVICVLRPTDSATAAVDTAVNTFRADVEKAIFGSTSWWITGMAEVSYTAPEGVAVDDGSYEGVRLRVNITYRTERGDPYTAR